MPEQESEKEKNLENLAMSYYSRKDIQQAIFNFCKNRETIARHFDFFSKRPDVLNYPSEIIQQVKNRFSSFHCSQELWSNPLELETGMNQEKLNELRNGWDLLIDIDSKYLDYSKITAELLIKALSFHGVKNVGVKFSGGKGMHIIVPWKAFPEEINNVKTKDMFPEYPRIITKYLNELVKKELVEKITQLTTDKSYVKDEDEAKKVIPDLVLVSSRHLFRCPYSLHEKGLSSVVIGKEEISRFNPRLANPLRVQVKNFYPNAEQEEARELLISALDWNKEQEKGKKQETIKRTFQEIKIDKSKIVYPPCIETIMKGMQDGKKRALFILINYFRSLSLDWEEIEKKLDEWNKLNKPLLKQNYIQSQIDWSKRQKQMLPPNCDKDYYKAIGVCQQDFLCEKIKNPVNYTIRKQRQNK